MEVRPCRPERRVAPLLLPTYFKYSRLLLEDETLTVANSFGHEKSFSVAKGRVARPLAAAGIAFVASFAQMGAVSILTRLQRLLVVDANGRVLARLFSTPSGAIGLPKSEDFDLDSTWPLDEVRGLCERSGLSYVEEWFDSVDAMTKKFPGAVRVPWIYRPSWIQRRNRGW